MNSNYQYNQKKPTIFALVLISCFLILNQNAHSQNFCNIQQITDELSGISSRPTVNSSASLITFQSNTDLTGDNNDGNIEIFLFNNGNFVQVTNSQNPIINLSPAVNALGTYIAFISNGNYAGNNLDGSDEVFLYDIVNQSIQQITDTNTGGNDRPSISASGSKIAFESIANINNGNIDGNSEIYLYDKDTNSITQITNETNGNSLIASINADGSKIAFQSSANITNMNPDNNIEIFLADTNSNIIRQLTDTFSGNNTSPSIDDLGERIAFHSTSNINGGNSDGNQEIVLFDNRNNSLNQITNTLSMFGSNDPSISGNGEVIAFNSAVNLNFGIEGVNQLYLYFSGQQNFIKVAPTTSGLVTNPDTNQNGSVTAFQSASNINGLNPENNSEIFLARCPIPGITEIPTLSEWGLIAMSAILGFVGFLAIRRKKTLA